MDTWGIMLGSSTKKAHVININVPTDEKKFFTRQKQLYTRFAPLCGAKPPMLGWEIINPTAHSNICPKCLNKLGDDMKKEEALKEEALMAEIERVKKKNRTLTAKIKQREREIESGNICLQVNRNPQFLDDLAEVILAIAKGNITDRVSVDPVAGRIYTTGCEPTKQVMWRLVPATDLVDHDLDVVNSDIDLIKASIVNDIIIEVYKL